MAAKKPPASRAKRATTVESIKHQDTRVNIPTEELRGFVADDEAAPGTMLYPRDPSLDPQLVWKGKDEQDREDLAVPVVPVYIQEKVHPQALIENLRDTSKAGEPEPEQLLFADFNGIEDFDKKVEFYQHEGHWSNRMILGDSLLVMTSLAEKEGLKGKVQCIYFDPPYGIKFGSNWQVSTRKRDVKDGKAEDATRQPEQVRAFRDTWQLGIHSYLAYLRDRLVVARELLNETGSVFVQIGDENVHLVRSVMDEVFGAENFHATIVFRTSVPLTSAGLASVSDYILWFTKDHEFSKHHDLFVERESGEKSRYSSIELSDGSRRGIRAEEKDDPGLVPAGSRPFALMDLASSGYTASCIFDYEYGGRSHRPASGKSWKTTKGGLDGLARAGRLSDSGRTLRYVLYLDDFPVTKLPALWADTTGELDKSYVVQTHTRVIERCLLMTTDPGDLVLDPTCGSGTAAYVAEQWGRRWITVDTSRVALALARTRLMTAKYPYFLLADSPEGVQREAEITGRIPPPHPTGGDVRKGFVCKRVPHVTLKSIANNPDIKEGMSREEIDAAILRHADVEVLHDKPYEDNKRIRVTGPFTVESLSPHRVLSTELERPATAIEGQRASSVGQFEVMILDNLKKSGIDNRKKGERIRFDSLEPHAGTWIHAIGQTPDGQRIAVSIGPEHGTVGPMQVKEAAKEAVRGVPFDVLVICGFAFDPYVEAEEVRQYGKLTVLAARMNPDLSMGEDLLKKTGAGNLFVVFGEPDVKVEMTKDGKIVVKLLGVDVYDPTTGQVRSDSTDDVACWFIDTDYDGESFFVRHAYFTGAGDPYEKLKRALRAEIDESTWSALYRTESRPFPKPSTGKIAVKVINHYGDEVLKVITP